jgi:hypothetical protein
VSAAALLWALPAIAQVPAPEPAPPPPQGAPPPPQAAPPLQPAPPPEPTKRPAFLHTREEMERINRAPAAPPPAPVPQAPRKKVDFFDRASPWVDFALTSYYLEDRVDNVLNLGVQAGAYLFEHLRVSARLVAPLEATGDSYHRYDSGFDRVKSRDITLLYGFSVGLVMSNGRAFAFGPSVALLRTDVEAYGSAWFVTLPFEWTTARNLRMGFELGLGHAFGGEQRQSCSSSNCGISTVDRPGGTSLLGQFNVGYALGSL